MKTTFTFNYFKETPCITAFELYSDPDEDGKYDRYVLKGETTIKEIFIEQYRNWLLKKNNEGRLKELIRIRRYLVKLRYDCIRLEGSNSEGTTLLNHTIDWFRCQTESETETKDGK
jgi:hypothetical protein